MSIIGKLSRDPIAVIPALLEEYDAFLGANEDLFETEGVLLEKLCKTLSKSQSIFDRKLQDLKTIEDYVRENLLGPIESRHWKRYNEGYSRSLSTRDIQAYIKGEPDYVAMYEVLLEVVHLKRQYEAVVEAIKTMHWQLNNVVKLRIEQLELIVI
jgi:hypothetical protein